MKVTFITYTYPYPRRGFNAGIERVIESLAENLAKKGHEIHVITTYERNGGKNETDDIHGVKIHRVKDLRDRFGRLGSVFSLDLLSINFFAKKYQNLLLTSDVIHAFTPFLLNSPRVPVVSHFHHSEKIRSCIQCLYLPTNSLLWKKTYLRSDAVLSVSSYSSKYLHHIGIPQDKVYILPNGVDTEKFQPGIVCSAIRHKFGGKKILLYVGHLSKRKGLEYLIRCMPKVLIRHPDTILLLVGKGNQEKNLKHLSASLGISDHIIFEGFVSEELLPQYYNACYFFVFPSLQEGFGMVLIEAMACGKTVVAADDSAIPEIAGNAGLLVKPKDPTALSNGILELLNNKQKKEKLEMLALKRAQDNFTWKASTDKLVSIYGRIKEEVPEKRR